MTEVKVASIQVTKVCTECNWPMEPDDGLGFELLACTNPHCLHIELVAEGGMKLDRCRVCYTEKNETDLFVCSLGLCATHCVTTHMRYLHHMPPEEYQAYLAKTRVKREPIEEVKQNEPPIVVTTTNFPKPNTWSLVEPRLRDRSFIENRG